MTLFFAVVTVSLETVIGMIFALMMNRGFRGRSLVRVAILIPWAIPTAVTAKLWSVIFDPQGILNQRARHQLRLDVLDVAGPLGDRHRRHVEDHHPFMQPLLILAGLQGISADLYESATVDGANAWQRFWRITLPLVKPALAVAVIFRALDALRMYDLPAILTGGSNGTTTMSILVVKQLHQRRELRRRRCPRSRSSSSSRSRSCSGMVRFPIQRQHNRRPGEEAK